MPDLSTDDLFDLQVTEKGRGNALYATTVILCCSSCSCFKPA